MTRIYDDPSPPPTSDQFHHYKDFVVDAQYQYLLDPRRCDRDGGSTARERRLPSPIANQPSFDANVANPLTNTNSTDTTNVFRAS